MQPRRHLRLVGVQAHTLHKDICRLLPASQRIASVITIDPESATTGKEPLATLATFRRSAAGVLFGQNCATREPALLETGAPVEVLEERDPEEVHRDFRLD